MATNQRIHNHQNSGDQNNSAQINAQSSGQHSSQKINTFVYYLACLCLSLTVSTAPVYAGSIKTLDVKQLLPLGPATVSKTTQEKHSTTDDGQESAPATLQLPSDVAVLKDKVYVVDGSNHRIAVFDLHGKFLFSFGSHGNKPGQFDYPVGIDAAKNRVYVVDSGNNRIQIFSGKGDFLSSFSVKDGRPVDILRHSKTGNLIVSSSNHVLLTYSSKGKLLKKWGENGTSRGEFRYPATLSELKDGRIAVIDVLNSRAQVFSSDGSVSQLVGEWGVLPGQLYRPKGIAIDSKGNFYISDSYMGVVQKFSDDGRFSAVLGKQGKPYKLLTPVGMTIYKNRLYVVEMKNNKVSVFQLKD